MGENVKRETIGYGPELYHQVQRLICQWAGQDAGQQRESMRQLVADIVTVSKGYDELAARTASHDPANAA